MSDPMIRPSELPRLDGSEIFGGINATVVEFWRWALGDLRMNYARGYLAEFLVAKAVGSTDAQRVEWGSHDVTAPDDTRIEVTSTAYLQSCPQRRLSAPRFSLKGATTVWDTARGIWIEPVGGRVDVWVLALQTCTDHTLYDPLSVAQWTFWVIPAHTIDDLGQDGATLSTVQRIAGAGVAWEHLQRAVEAAAREQRRRLSRRATPQDADESPVSAIDPVAKVIKHAKVLGDPAQWESATTYDSLALAVIDAVWSIGVRYTGVLNVLKRYRDARRRQAADPERDTPADLASFIEACGGPEAFAAAVDNRQRTSTRSGILKAEAVLLAARVLVDSGIDTPRDLAESTPQRTAELRTRWTAVAGQSSGLSWDYFLMLCGLQGVKADRMVRRFVAEAIGVDGHAVSQPEAHRLVTYAAGQLGVDVSQLDYAIWLYQSGNRPAR